MALKIRYPAGVPLDDLDVGRHYRLSFRGHTKSFVGELRELLLVSGKCPRLVVLPNGKPHQVGIPISQLAEIAPADVDLTNSDYRDEKPDFDVGGECG